MCNMTIVISGYSPLKTNQGDTSPDIFRGNGQPSCNPGTGASGAYYSDTYGGLCGDQQYVHKLGHEYQVTDGIGGSLLSQ